jgi:NADH-quinone oxidoreductase subunit F
LFGGLIRFNMTGAGGTIRIAAGWDSRDADRLVAAAREDADAVTLIRAGPVGIAGWDPVLFASTAEQTAVYPAPALATIGEVIEAVEAGEFPAETSHCVSHPADAPRRPQVPTTPLDGRVDRVVGHAGWTDPFAPADVPASVDLLAGPARAVRGRGWGDAAEDLPVGEVWDRLPADATDAIVVVNAADPHRLAQVDRFLMASQPARIIATAAALCDAMGAEDLVVVLPADAGGLAARLTTAVEIDAPVAVQVVCGPDRFHATEPRALVEYLEGNDRIEPRRGPPGPEQYGVFGRPTVIHTPRTLAQVAGVELRGQGGEDPGTRLFHVCGDVRVEQTVELDPSDPIGAAITAADPEDEVAMAIVGGVFGGFTTDLTLPAGAASLQAAGVGTDGVIEVCAPQRCPVRIAGDRISYAAESNSGRCVPGREGTVQLTELLRGVYSGDLDAAAIEELSRVMRHSSNCRLAAAATRPVTTALAQFRGAFEAHAAGQCPAGGCPQLS